MLVDACGRPCGVLPVGPRHVLPPLTRIVTPRQLVRHFENHRACLAHDFGQAGMQLGVHWALCHGDIARGFDKVCKLLVGDFSAVHPKAFDLNIAHRLFFRIDAITHVKGARWHPHHARVRCFGIRCR